MTCASTLLHARYDEMPAYTKEKKLEQPTDQYDSETPDCISAGNHLVPLRSSRQAMMKRMRSMPILIPCSPMAHLLSSYLEITVLPIIVITSLNHKCISLCISESQNSGSAQKSIPAAYVKGKPFSSSIYTERDCGA